MQCPGYAPHFSLSDRMCNNNCSRQLLYNLWSETTKFWAFFCQRANTKLIFHSHLVYKEGLLCAQLYKY